mmetsp:Transcript_32873/g.45868  ORF Transcript_32873/g.45868 Transcript_32873/m.45868 type:complete len:366 (+) Transcript_32873:219-1316(+)
MVKTPGIPRPMHLVGATCCVTAMVFLLHNSGGFRKDTPSSLGAPVRNSIAPFAPLMPRFAKHKPTGPFRCPPAERRIDGRGLCPPPSSSLSLPASSLSAKARLAPAPGNSDSKALTTGLLSPQYPKLVLRPLGGTRKFRRPERVMLRPPGARWENKFVWSDLDPMKVARHKEDSGRRIVMCVDSSEHSIQALEWCNKKLFTKNDDVHLLHVYDFDPIAPSSSMQGPLDLQLDSAVESLGDQNRQLEISGEHKAIQMMIDYQRKCMEIGTLAGKPSATVMRGSCNHEICDYAVTHNADLLVVASRGLGAVRRFLLGSVSGYCVHNCKVPVLVVKEDGSSKTQNRMLNLKGSRKREEEEDGGEEEKG